MSVSRNYRMWPAYCVLGVSLALTIAVCHFIENSIQSEQLRRSQEDKQRFDQHTAVLRQVLETQFNRYVDALASARTMIAAVGGVTRERWILLGDSLRLSERFPGVRGLGYAQRVEAGGVSAFEAARTEEQHSPYKVIPAGQRPIYFPVTYTVTSDGTPPRFSGFDMFSETQRHDAMQLAATEDKAVATGKVALIGDAKPTPSFLIYLPVYRTGTAIDTPSHRQDALMGFVYFTYRAAPMITQLITANTELSQLKLRVWDGTSEKPDAILYDSIDATPTAETHLTKVIPASYRQTITLANHEWTLDAIPSQEASLVMSHRLPWLVLAVGGLVSWLLFAVIWLEIRGAARSEFAAMRLAESEERLRESELRYRLKIEQSPLAVQTFAPDGTPTAVNQAWEELWGLSLADLNGYNVLHDTEFERHQVQSLIERAFSGSTVTLGPLLYDPPVNASGKKGRSRWVRSVVYPVKDTHDHIKEVVLIHQDVTDRKAVEAQLREAKETAEAANIAKDEFLAVLSHELRNPLAPVLSMVNVLQSPTIGRPEMDEALDVIRRNVQLEARLIDDLLDITRIVRGKLHLDIEPVDVHLILNHAVQICREDAVAKGVVVEMELGAEQRVIAGDSARLQQIFWNLIKNAVKFTPTGGTLRVITANTTVTAGAEGARAEVISISVSDTGIGIEAEKLPRVFDAFEQADQSITRRFGGLGLGLAITRALVEGHHGTIMAESAGSGKGATFTVNFALPAEPLKLARMMPMAGSQANRATSSAPTRILLIEDQDDARRGLRVLLERQGFHVNAASNGEEALLIAREGPYDLIISDIGLPDLSGFDLLPQLLAIHMVPAIALTGFGMEQDVQRAREVGFTAHLTKPVHFDRLEDTIQLILQPVVAER